MPAPDCRLGVDVGGTNTDAVIMDAADRVIAKAKVPGSADITAGIVAAIDAVLRAPGTDPGRIGHVMLGTTHATNAVLERRNLRKVAVIRIGGPATYSIRPMFGWPPDLVQAVSVGATMVDGGIEFDGQELSPLDTGAIARFLGEVGGGADGVAITSVFAPVSARHELLAAEVVKRELGDVHTSLSHEIGSIGLLERENATILNGALAGVARDVASAMQGALTAHGLRPVTLFAQNDGTLMGLDQALRYPVLTIGSGPANSVRGAAFLTGMSDSLVADVGGTSTDVGVLASGFPRESAQGVEIGGVRTNFRMPDLVTIALGGGTVVSDGPDGVRIGPRSVGYLLPQEALVFGGTTPTLTDSAVAAGRAALGSAGPGGASGIGRHKRMLTEALARADVMLAEAIDRVKTSQEDRPLIAVGGGSILVPGRIPGVSEIVRPEHFDAANAVGAAIASVSGQVDRIFHLGADGRQAVLDEARDEARERAVAAGANPDTVQIIEVEEIPLAYLTSPAVRIRVKAAGTLGGVPEHHLQAGQGTGLDRKHIGGNHEAPSPTAGRSRRCRRAGPDPGRVWRVHLPKYWGGWSGTHFTKVVFRVVPQDSTAAQLLRSGQVTFIEQISSPLWSSFKGDSRITLVSSPSGQNLLAQLNVKALSLPVRQAILYAVDYKGIIAALRGAGVLSSGLVPPGLFGHFSDLPDYSYDKARAADLLNQVGYGPGKKKLNLSLTYTQGDSNEQVVATIIKSDLAALNVNLSVQSLAWPTQWAKGKSANPAQRQDIFLEYWWPDYADPYSWFVNLLATENPPSYNLSYYSNKSMDNMIGQVEPLVATNTSAAAQLYRNMQVTVLQQAPVVSLYNNNYQYAMLSGISGFRVDPAYPNVVFVYNLKP